MKKFIAIAMVVIITVVSYIFLQSEPPKPKIVTERFEFNDGENLGDTWHISKWGETENDESLYYMEGGVLRLSSDYSGFVPYMYSKAFPINSKSVITVKRRVRIHHGDGSLNAGLAFYQTNNVGFDLVDSETFGGKFGDGISLIEYSYDLETESTRPGRDIFRFLAADWEYSNNYKLTKSVFGEWFEEKFIFDLRTSQMSYTINDEKLGLTSLILDKDNFRIVMHPYGKGSGNLLEIDYVEITIEDKSKK